MRDQYSPPSETLDHAAYTLDDDDDNWLVDSFDESLASFVKGGSPAAHLIRHVFGPDPEFTINPNLIRWAWFVVEQESVNVPDDPMRLLATSPDHDDSQLDEPVTLLTVPHLYIPQASISDS